MATDSAAFTFTAPPPRQRRHPEPAPSDPGPPEPVIGSGGNPPDLIAGSPEPAWAPAPDATAVTWSPDPTTVAPAARGPVPAPAAPAPAPVFAGTLGTPGAARLDERGNLPGGVAGLVAAALVAIGVFLPWIGVEGRDVSGWAASADAKVLLVIAALATVAAALLVGGARSLVLRLGLVGLGVATLGLGAYEVASARGIDDFDVSLGTGLVLVLVGGVVLAGAGALTRHRRFV